MDKTLRPRNNIPKKTVNKNCAEEIYNIII
nr:MAG TPA: hypothetical protein [Caudoviricetes sp.]DAQ83875.1 MAG TPA: hypothetical protein [Caudoviricetes sp.]